MKKIIVISLGGSLIIPDKINFRLIHEFRHVLRKHYRAHRFVVVCGGGAIARAYILALSLEKKSNKELALAGIRATRMNAQFVMQVFGREANDALPSSMKEVKDNLQKNNAVICGALRFSRNSTSDSTAAKLAHYLKCDFINMTNVDGLYSANPKTHKNAKFISLINWKDFEKIALGLKFEAGQHFVLDQNAATMIRENKIRTYIIGPKLLNLDKILHGRKFRGTVISG